MIFIDDYFVQALNCTERIRNHGCNIVIPSTIFCSDWGSSGSRCRLQNFWYSTFNVRNYFCITDRDDYCSIQFNVSSNSGCVLQAWLEEVDSWNRVVWRETWFAKGPMHLCFRRAWASQVIWSENLLSSFSMSFPIFWCLYFYYALHLEMF